MQGHPARKPVKKRKDHSQLTDMQQNGILVAKTSPPKQDAAERPPQSITGAIHSVYLEATLNRKNCGSVINQRRAYMKQNDIDSISRARPFQT
jgi:hypothetical protein